MRHLEVKILWLQELVQKGRVQVGKVSGKGNIADALTKYHSVARLCELCRPHGIVPVPVCGPDSKDCRAEGGCKATGGGEHSGFKVGYSGSHLA